MNRNLILLQIDCHLISIFEYHRVKKKHLISSHFFASWIFGCFYFLFACKLKVINLKPNYVSNWEKLFRFRNVSTLSNAFMVFYWRGFSHECTQFTGHKEHTPQMDIDQWPINVCVIKMNEKCLLLHLSFFLSIYWCVCMQLKHVHAYMHRKNE